MALYSVLLSEWFGITASVAMHNLERGASSASVGGVGPKPDSSESVGGLERVRSDAST